MKIRLVSAHRLFSPRLNGDGFGLLSVSSSENKSPLSEFRCDLATGNIQRTGSPIHDQVDESRRHTPNGIIFDGKWLISYLASIGSQNGTTRVSISQRV